MKLSERLARLGTETAFEVLVRARALEAQGRSVVHLEIGEPDFDTPQHIIEAGIEALRSGATHYGPAAGLPELRQAVAEERNRIARAIGLFETLIGPKNGTLGDLAMNPPDAPQSPRGGQLDCISESTNSTTYLKQLEASGLLRWHSVDERAVRRRGAERVQRGVDDADLLPAAGRLVDGPRSPR